MKSNLFFKIVDGKSIALPAPSWFKEPEKSTIVYTKFPNIVEGGSFCLPSMIKTVDDLHGFISAVEDAPINKGDVDYFFKKLQGSERDKFINLFGVEETSVNQEQEPSSSLEMI